MFGNRQGLVDRIVFTPAERAVVVEKAEALKLDLDVLIDKAKNGTTKETLRAMLPVPRASEEMGTMISQKLKALLLAEDVS